MLPAKNDHRCLSCKEAKAIVTGLCSRCYSRLRYHELLDTDHETEDQEESEPSEDQMSWKYCEHCNCPMHPGGTTRADSGTYNRKRFLQTYYCSRCGYETSGLP